MILNNEKMMMITGGGALLKVVGAIGTAVVFLIGVISGFVNPKRCNK